MFRLLICVIGTWLVSSCSPRNDRLEFALASAGANKEELVKVLRHYEGDSLKYRATCFLIENMPYHGYYEGKALAKYRKYFEIYADGNHDAQQLVDSLKGAGGGFSERELVRKRDIEKIDSAYLVRNIDFAFRVWREQPWGKQVTFDDFCEYILPYRVGDEPLADWREEVYRKYNPLLDSIRYLPEAEDPLVAAQAIMDEWGKIPFKWTSLFPGGPHIGADAVEWRSGSCREYTDGVVYLLRALGIPAGIDKAMQRGDNNASHFWAFTLDKNGETYVSEPKVWTKAKEHDVVKAKVARVTYGINWEIVERAKDFSEIYPVFRPPLFKDVSRFYEETPCALRINENAMYREVAEDEPVYLCLSEHLNWRPIDFAFPEGGEVKFDDVDGGVVAVLAAWKENRLEVLTDPFRIDKETGRTIFFHPQEEKKTVPVYCKFNLNFGDWVYRIVGGVIEGSNRRDFGNADTLYHITDFPYRLFTEVRSWQDKPYRYVRYRGSDGTYCNIGELELYEVGNDSVCLTGKVIGTHGSYFNDGVHDCAAVFDGDPFVWFDYKDKDGGWVGLDLGKSKRIGKIVYAPRNRRNFVCKGQCFELFYFGNGKWNSLGRRVADSDVLRYEVPQGALLYLRNHTEGQDERIFEMVEGRQKFW